MSSVRRSFAVADWVELGEKYSKAREALVAVRDKNVAKLKGGKGTVELFANGLSISARLGEEAAGIDFFKQLDAERPKLAGRCYLYAEVTLAAGKEYALCSKYVPDPGGL